MVYIILLYIILLLQIREVFLIQNYSYSKLYIEKINKNSKKSIFVAIRKCLKKPEFLRTDCFRMFVAKIFFQLYPFPIMQSNQKFVSIDLKL
jgi:hypothetical protein